jgi:hypothetical protein
MAHIQRVAVLIPMVVGVTAVLGTILIHGVALNATLNFVRREQREGHTGISFWMDIAIIAPTISLALVAHRLEIGLWGMLFLICGEFPEFGTAYYHSAVNYTSLGYGDLIMSPSWRLLGPLEAINGAVMFGVTTAMIFALIERLLRARFAGSN